MAATQQGIFNYKEGGAPVRCQTRVPGLARAGVGMVDVGVSTGVYGAGSMQQDPCTLGVELNEVGKS